MVNLDLKCELLVMPCTICREDFDERLFAADCEIHEVTSHSTLFADALGRALMHRQYAVAMAVL